MKKNQLNKEEEILREKLNQVEFGFQPDDWTAFQKQLPSSGGGTSWFSGKSIVGAAVVVSLTVAWFISQDDKTVELPQNKADKAIVISSDQDEEPKASVNEQKELEINEGKDAVESKLTERPKQEKTAPVDQSAQNNDPIHASEESVNDAKDEGQKTLEEEVAALDSQNDLELEENKPAIEKPIITGLSAPEKVCEGGQYAIALEMENELPKGYTIDWYVAGNLLSKDSRISGMKLKDNGINQFKIVVKDPKGEVFQSYEKVIETAELPELDFTYADLKDPYQDFNAEVTVDPELYQSYQWFDENEELLAEGAKSMLHFHKQGYYDVKLKAKTQSGCVQTLEKPLKIEADFDPMAPNAITPLNQDGLNDSFMPESFKSRDDRFKMQILTLDGRLIFETNSVLEEWNGKQNNSGQMMPAGLYVWKVIISNTEGRHRTFFGNVRITP